MSYLGYDVNKDVSQQPVALNIGGALQAGQQFSEGLLKNYQMKQQIGMAGQLNQLKQQYLNAPDAQTQQGLLNKMMVLDPTSAKTMAEGQQILGSPLQGTSDLAIVANAQYKSLIGAGYPPEQAKAMALNASLNSNGAVNALGNFQSKPPLPAITPYAGQLSTQTPPPAQMNAQTTSATTGQLGVPLPPYGTGNNPSAADKVVSMADHVNNATPEEANFVNNVITAKNPAQVYNAGVKNHPDLAVAHPQYDDAVASHFKEIHNTMNENIPNGGIVRPNNNTNAVNPINTNVIPNPQNAAINSPVGQKALTEARATGAVADENAIQKDAESAGASAGMYQNIYSIYKGGFTGGAFSTAKVDAIKAKQALKQELSPQELQYSDDYTTLKNMADMGILEHLKEWFPGRVSNFDVSYAKNTMAQAGDMPNTAIVKAAIREASDQEKIQKNQFKDQWNQQYGSLAAKSPSGQSFSDAFQNQLNNHPIMTPAYFAQRGVAVPIRQFGQMSPQEVADSLPSGSRYINPSDNKIYIKK